VKDFITYDLRCVLNKKQVFDKAIETLSAFAWRQGDSDAQGPYVSGTSDDHVQVKLWLGEAPIAMSVSFRRAWPEVPDREGRKNEVIDLIERELIPVIGTIMKADK
jgi:hypothetical protein